MLLLAANSYCQKTFSIKILNETGEALSGVTVSRENNEALGITDAAGKFFFEQQADSLIIIFTAGGYLTNRSLVVKNIYKEIILTKKTAIKAEETITVFGRKSTLTNAAAAVAIINKSSLDKYDQQSFTAAFNTVPGVKMDERSPGSYRLNIRGNLLRSTFGVRNVKIYLNELPITDASGNTYFNQLAPALINTVQIIKGPGGSMYGAGTGGVVLLRNDAVQKSGTDLSISGGSYGLFTASTTNHFSTKKTNSSFTVAHQQADGYREHSAMKRDVAGYTVAYRPNDKHTITSTTYYSNLFYQTPGGLTAAQVIANPRQARPATALFKGAVAQKAAIYLSTIYASVADVIVINSNWKNTTGAYFSYTDFKNPSIRNYEKRKERGAGARTVFQFEQNKFTAGAGAELQYSFINTATHGNRLGVKDTLQYRDEINVNQLNIFIQGGYKFLKHYTINGGLSYNYFKYGFNRLYPAENPSAAGFTPQYIPRISLQRNIPTGSLYATYSRGYSPPTIDEIHAGNGVFNKDLKAETNTSYEAGTKITLVKNLLFAELAFYKTNLTNTIVVRKIAGGGDFFVNAGSTTLQGIESSFNAYPLRKPAGFVQSLQLQLTGNMVKARFKDFKQGTQVLDGRKLTGTTPFSLSFMADVITAHFYTNLTYNYTDRIPLNDANTFFAKAYNLLFVKFGTERSLFRKVKANLFVSIMHSFNKNYSLGNDLNADGNRFFNPSMLQSFTAGAKFILPGTKALVKD